MDDKFRTIQSACGALLLLGFAAVATAQQSPHHHPRPPSVRVYVSYAENERPSIFMPNPWLGSPKTRFLGYPGSAWDTGGILIQNTDDHDVLLGPGVVVDNFYSPLTRYQLWDSLIGSGVRIRPGEQVILAQTMADGSTSACTRGVTGPCFSNFDTSDTGPANSHATATPQIHVTLDGHAMVFTDTGQILNTGGSDLGNGQPPRNESLQWRLIATTGANLPGGSGVDPAPVRTWHSDNRRTGRTPRERTLNPGNVNPSNFGQLWTGLVDGKIYAQPLFVANVRMAGQGLRNVVVVATENNSVWAFDAESAPGTGTVLWGPVTLGTPVPSGDVSCFNISPTLGVTGTPVIDTEAGTIYVVSENEDTPGVFAARLHALDLRTGNERANFPKDIAGRVRGTGDGTNGTFVDFNPKMQFQRAALLLHRDSLYVAFGSHCDTHPYHGWMFKYNLRRIDDPPEVFNTTPNATSAPATASCSGWAGYVPAGGAFWMGGAGPAADEDEVFATSGNGTFDANLRHHHGAQPAYGDTILKLKSRQGRLEVADYFTPFDQKDLACNDNDLGSSGPLLLPGARSSPLLVQTYKIGTIYLVDRKTGSMGQYHNIGSCSPPLTCNHIVQELDTAVGPTSATPAYFDERVYFQGSSDVMKAFTLSGGQFSPPTPSQQSAVAFSSSATPSISYDEDASDPMSTAIVWAIQPDNWQAVLHAYAASDLRELYHSAPVSNSVNFGVPTVSAGKVFFGVDNQLFVFGGGFF